MNPNMNVCPSCGSAGEEPCDPDCQSKQGACSGCGAADGMPCDCRDARSPDNVYDRQFEGIGSACDSCGAPETESCDDTCQRPVEDNSDVTTGDWLESAGFNKFMDRIITEQNRKGLPVMNDSPQRKIALRYQERPMGRTRMGIRRS